MDLLKRKQKADGFLNKLNLKSTSKVAFWEVLDDMLAYLYQNFTEEIIEHELDVKSIREASINKYHASQNKGERLMGSFPMRFYNMIRLYTNNFQEMPYKNTHDFHTAFFKRYKQFSYAEVI